MSSKLAKKKKKKEAGNIALGSDMGLSIVSNSTSVHLFATDFVNSSSDMTEAETNVCVP